MMLPYIRQTFDKLFVAILCVVILTTGALLYSRHANTSRIDFENYKGCEDLVQISLVYGIRLSPMNQLKSKEFEEAIGNATDSEIVEGHSGQVMGQYLIMHHLAGQPSVNVICETGFNLGHSSFSYLTSNENAIVHSFDLGNHAYAHKMSDYLKKLFPTRFFIHFGNSTKTIPEFIRNNPEVKCDLMFVDGGHVYPVALADIRNFARMANMEENIMAFDDYPTDWGKSFGKAWDDAIEEGFLKEFTRCSFRHFVDLQRGFTIGRVLRKPAEDDVAAKKP